MDIGSYTLYDKVIDLTFYKYIQEEDTSVGVWSDDNTIIQDTKYTSPDGTVYKKVINRYIPDVTISCKDYGLKPDISLSFKAVPGRNVTQCEIRIVNLQLDSYRLKEWAMVEVTAGYRGVGVDYGKTKLSVDIFSSWTESPNPDGVTVIQGIATGGALGMFFGPRKFYIQFNVEEVTIRELLERLLNQEDVLSFPTFREDIELPFLNKKIGKIKDAETGAISESDKTFGELKIQVQNIRLSAESGYQVVQWLGRELYEWGKARGFFIMTNIFNERVRISCTTEGDFEEGGEDVVILSVIDTASFTGGTLSVKCPWIPSLIPGGVFKLDSRYFSLQNTYRRVDPSIYSDKYGLFRCITTEVSFDTCGSTNQMSIFAIPYSKAQDPWNEYGEADVSFLDDEKNKNLSLEQWAQEKSLNDTLITTVLFGKSDVETKGQVQQDTFWAKIKDEKIDGINGKAIHMNDLVNKESLTAVNWYRTFIDTALSNGHGTSGTGGKDKTYRAYPVLSRSEMQKILKAINADNIQVSLGMKSKLRMSKSLNLNPDTLWILYPIYAYLQSLEHGGSLASIMDKNNLGALLISSFNTHVENSPESPRKKTKPGSNIPMDSFTIKPADETVDTDIVYIPDVTGAKLSSSPEGSRDDWKKFKAFHTVMAYVIADESMYKNSDVTFDWDMFVVWYYYFMEVVE